MIYASGFEVGAEYARRSGYDNEGQPVGRAGLLNRLGYPEGPVAYFEYIDAWRSTGDFEGLTFR